MNKVRDPIGFVFSLWKRYYGGLKPLIMSRNLVADWRQTMLLIAMELDNINIIDQAEASSFVQKLFRTYFFNPYAFKRRENIWQFFETNLSDTRNNALNMLYFGVEKAKI